MKVRSATYFYSASCLQEAIDGMKQGAKSISSIKTSLTNAGYEVQTTRIATNSFEEYLSGSTEDVLAGFKELEAASGEVAFISVGTVEERFDVMEAALAPDGTKKLFFAAPLQLNKQGIPDLTQAKKIAESVCKLGKQSPAKTNDVPDVFRMTVTANLEAGAPYFPGGYWKRGQAPALAIALEDSGLLVESFEGAASLEDAQQRLYTTFAHALQPLETIAKRAAEAERIDYAGIDCSIASSSAASESLVKAYEAQLGPGQMGGAGTLSISAIITAVMKRLPVERCGYSGLMLPVTEDAGLAARAGQGRLSVQQLLFYSSVCGTGIDTVPIEGSTSPDRLAFVYLDMASLAFRLRKPLSARVWPVAGKKAGDMTEVNNPFFVNSKVLSIDPPQIVPCASALEVAGVNGEVTMLSNSPEALVIKLEPSTTGLGLVMQNTGDEAWGEVCLKGLDCDHSQHLPLVAAGESVTLGLIFQGSSRSSRFRLSAHGQHFGPVIIVID